MIKSGVASRAEGPARAELPTYRKRTYIKPCDSIFVVMTSFMARTLLQHASCSMFEVSLNAHVLVADFSCSINASV